MWVPEAERFAIIFHTFSQQVLYLTTGLGKDWVVSFS